jgi:hypothetical protein
MIQVARRDLNIYEHEGEYYIGSESNDSVFLRAKIVTEEDSIRLMKRPSGYYPQTIDIDENTRLELGWGGIDDNELVSYTPATENTMEVIRYRVNLDWSQAKKLLNRSKLSLSSLSFPGPVISISTGISAIKGK